MMKALDLKRIRDRLDLTQEQLAKKLEIDRVTLARYETDARPIPKKIELAVTMIEQIERRPARE